MKRKVKPLKIVNMTTQLSASMMGLGTDLFIYSFSTCVRVSSEESDSGL